MAMCSARIPIHSTARSPPADIPITAIRSAQRTGRRQHDVRSVTRLATGCVSQQKKVVSKGTYDKIKGQIVAK